MTTAHIYADKVRDWETSEGYDAALHTNTAAGDFAVGVASLDELIYALGRIPDSSLDAMDFHTHGRGGGMRLGRDLLTSDTLPRLRDARPSRIFRRGAPIDIMGCNVAESPEGELFLAEFGSIFLKERGGRVRAHTGRAFRDPLYTGETVHLIGQWITAEVRPGGGVTLNNAIHLVPHLIRNAIERIGSEVDRLGQGQVSSARHAAVTDASERLRSARSFIGSPGDQPSYRYVYYAYEHLARAAPALHMTMAY